MNVPKCKWISSRPYTLWKYPERMIMESTTIIGIICFGNKLAIMMMLQMFSPIVLIVSSIISTGSTLWLILLWANILNLHLTSTIIMPKCTNLIFLIEIKTVIKVMISKTQFIILTLSGSGFLVYNWLIFSNKQITIV